MSRVMYDSVTLANCPHDGDLYGCYIDGDYRNDAEARRRFPGRRIVLITVTGSTAAHVVDCEPGDLTPTHAATWALRKKQLRQHGTIYCNTSTRPAVETACTHLGLVLGRDYSIWEAHYDGKAILPAGAVAKQYLGDYHGYDKSIVADHWPGVDPAPQPPAPKPVPTPAPVSEGDDVRLYIVDGEPAVWITNGLTRRWVQTPAERDQYVKDFGHPVIVLPKGSTFLNDIPIVGPVPK